MTYTRTIDVNFSIEELEAIIDHLDLGVLAPLNAIEREVLAKCTERLNKLRERNGMRALFDRRPML